MHIVIEGIDGSGKSTLVNALYDRVQADYSFSPWIYKTREPGSDIVGPCNIKFKRKGLDVREIVLNDTVLTPFQRELLFYVDADQHTQFIKDQGQAIIISDRGVWSHLAYVYATLKTKQMTYEQYLLCKDLIKQTCSKPDIIVYLKGDRELMSTRLASKKKDVIESNGPEFFDSVSSCYAELSCEPKYAKSLLILDAENSTSHNTESVVTYLKENYTYEQLKSGSI